MKCTIWTTLYTLNSDKKKEWRSLTYDGNSCWWGLLSTEKATQITKLLLRPENFHFSEWECIVEGFVPTSYRSWRWVIRNCSGGILSRNCTLLAENRIDWIPNNFLIDGSTSIRIYKVLDEDGHTVNILPYWEAYIKEYHRRRELNHQQYREWYGQKYSFWRHPHTKNEMSQETSPEEKRIWREEGWNVKTKKARENKKTANRLR